MQKKTKQAIKNKKKMKKENNIINLDAQDQSMGRLASKIAMILQGKHQSQYAPNKAGDTVVVVENLDRIRPFPETKLNTKTYYRHSGYIGHLRETKLAEKWEQDPAWVLKQAVRGMLPKNKLRAKRLKRLQINLHTN